MEGQEKKALEEKTLQEETGTEEKKGRDRFRNYYHIGVTVFLTFVCCILFFFMVLRYQGFAKGWSALVHAAEPIIIGLVLAYLLNPVMKFCENHVAKWMRALAAKRKSEPNEEKIRKSARALGVTGAILFLLIIIALLIAAIVPAVVNSVSTLIVTLPSQVESFLDQVKQGEFGNTEFTKYFTMAIQTISDYVEDWTQTKFLPEVETYVSQITSGVISVFKGIFNFIVGIIVAVYVMTIQEKLLAQSRKIIFAIFKPEYGNVIVHTIRHSSDIFGGFISGKLLDSAIIGVICYIACLIMQMPNAMLVSVIIGVTNIIPFFGPIIGAVPTILLVVIQSPWHALYLLIFIIILQQVDGNIIGPKILGDSTGLSSFWVMFAILVFGGIWGFLGMLLGVPTFAVIYYIIGKLVRYGLRKRNLPEATQDYYEARGVHVDTNTLRYAPKEEEKQEKRRHKWFHK